MSTLNCTGHEWESVEYTELIDKDPIVVEYECLNCGKTDFQYYKIDTEEEDE